jgi:hypothetical protein
VCLEPLASSNRDFRRQFAAVGLSRGGSSCASGAPAGRVRAGARRSHRGGSLRFSRAPGLYDLVVPRVHVVQESSAVPKHVLAAARDLSSRRADYWRDVHTEHLRIHERGDTWADVTEGNPWPIVGLLGASSLRLVATGRSQRHRRRIEPLQAGKHLGDSRNSGASGGSRVEIIALRHLQGRGRLLGLPGRFFPRARPTRRRRLPPSVSHEG